VNMFIDRLVTSCILFNSVSHASVVTTYFNVENESKATLCVEAGPEWFDVSETFGQSHNTIASEPNSTYVRFKLSIASVFATTHGRHTVFNDGKNASGVAGGNIKINSPDINANNHASPSDQSNANNKPIADGGFFALFLGAGKVGFRKNNKCEVRC
jgi:hypothetical protein